MKIKRIITGAFIVLTATYCGVKKNVLETPEYFPVPHYNFDNNPTSKAKIKLGNNLFYDPLLSANNSISCASCHSPHAAFAHTDHDLSHGIHDSIGTRNAPPLFNLAWQEHFMWDGAIDNLDAQALAPISHATEMGSSINEIVGKLKNHPKYPALFQGIYKDTLITGERILKVLAQFQISLISNDSKYDEVQRGIATFTQQEIRGYNIFNSNCASCHAEPLFSNYGFANNGLTIDSTLKDIGRQKITSNSSDSLLFKIPSLRNLAYTFPYMHDGRFKTLREVLKHYTGEIQKSPSLHIALKNGITLTKNEQTDLISFLRTLNDRLFITTQKHQINRSFFIENEGG
jgi:cytochrome c peroxidase